MSFQSKHIERLVRRTFLSLLRLMPGRRGDPRLISNLASPRILLLRPDRIGDAVISVPVVQMLRERFPNAAIDMLLGEKNRSAAPMLPGLDETLVIPADPLGIVKVVRRLRARRYDIVINLLAKNSASATVLASLAGGRFRIGFDGENGGQYDMAIAVPEPQMHIVRVTSLLLEPLGVAPIGMEPARPAERLAIVIPDEARQRAEGTMKALLHELASPIVVLNISASGTEKFLGVEKYAHTAHLLRAHGVSPVFAAAPGDSGLLDAIVTASGCRAIPVTRSLAEFAAMLGHADLIVTPDTSIVHIAAALGRPTVMMTSSSETYWVWRPWGVPYTTIIDSGGIALIEPEHLATSIVSLVSITAGTAPASSAS